MTATEDSDCDEDPDSDESSDSVSDMFKSGTSCLKFKLITGYYFITIDNLKFAAIFFKSINAFFIF